MAISRDPKPRKAPDTPFPPGAGQLHRQGKWLWVPLRSEWRDSSSKPEEEVRQQFIKTLCEDYGYSLSQIDQERRTMHGHRSPRADIVAWESATSKTENRTPVLVIECKAESIDINLKDYFQGESYTRATGCEFFVASNRRYTSVFKLVPGLPGEFVQLNEIPGAKDWGDAKRLDELRRQLRAFNRKEFQDLLLDCHNVLRDVHKMDPGRAFDTISKILFVKMYVERSGLHGTFTVDFLDRRASTRLPTDPAVHDGLFEQTKAYYKADELFASTDRLDISEETFRRIVKKLERFDLSKTGDDIKGLAFERFLGTTFRGELGQYFTPRPVVDFMISLLDPEENELICDPAAGSGGFLIRAFEHVRDKIARDIQRQKDSARAAIEAKGLDAEEEVAAIERAFATLNADLLPSGDDNTPLDTRVGRLAWKCIYGCDAEPRAARTAKMNMIMHGDGHGGIHYHDGLVDINGIFKSRFHVVMTNPPFGSNVGQDQKVGESEETRVPDDPQYRASCEKRYGDEWLISHQRMMAAASAKTKILDLFEIGRDKANRATELLFLERCLALLRPGGRMGIVLPDGNLNNPSLHWLRRWAEGKARILAVVSLPAETFTSADATVKASLVFMQRFTATDEAEWEAAWTRAHDLHDSTLALMRDELCLNYSRRIITGDSTYAEEILRKLAALGVTRSEISWSAGTPAPYPRGVVTSSPTRSTWVGSPTDRAAAKALRDELSESLVAVREQSTALWRELHAKLRDLDILHTRRLWESVRAYFDYPVFVAAPPAVGISSTGETGESVPNDLPSVLDAYRSFRHWVDNGAPADSSPTFLLPSTV